MDNASAIAPSSGNAWPTAWAAANAAPPNATITAKSACLSAATSGGAASDRRAKIRNPAPLAAMAAPLVERFADGRRTLGLPVAAGSFGAEMQVELVNDGPVTIWLDSGELTR